jgi:hypothetical protein
VFIKFQSKKYVLEGLTRPSGYWFPYLQVLEGPNMDDITNELLEKDPNANFYSFGSDFSGNPIVAVVNPDVSYITSPSGSSNNI